MKRTALAVLGVCVVLTALIAARWFLRGDDPVTAVGGLTSASLPASQAVAANKPPAAMVTGLEGLPPSLAGTEVDCAVATDAAGHLQATPGLRQCFDYFLSAVGEESPETLMARIRAQLRSRLQEPALGEAEKVLAGYVAYLRGVADIEKRQTSSTPGQWDLEKVRQQMQQVQALRRMYLAPDVIAAFFDEDDAYDRYTLARLELLQNRNLPAAARARQLATLDQQLPASLRDSLKTVNQYTDLRTLTEDWKKRGGSADELRQIRSNLVGEEATTRLEALDQENSAWDTRMAAWYGQRDAVLKNAGLSAQDRDRQLEELRRSHFGNEAERLRVQALERIHDGAPAPAS